MTDLFTNVKTYRLTRNSIDENNNNNTGNDNFWIKITKSMNELAKIQLVSRVFYDTGLNSIQSISGFDLFNIGNSEWNKNPADGDLTDLQNNNILILDFEDDSLDKRNFYLEGDDIEFPELKYLIVRVLSSEEIKKETITTGVSGEYYNYIFSGEIIGPKIFAEFNTNYCLKKTTIYKNSGVEGYTSENIINNTLENDTLNLYHPLNWCSLINTGINSYTSLDLKIKIEPIYSLNSQITDNKIQSVLSTILDIYVPSDTSSFYNEQKYELNDVFWCSLNSPRHLKIILASTANIDEILDNTVPNKNYLGVNNEGLFRYIKNFIFGNITSINGSEQTVHLGNTGGGYRKNPSSLELIRETYIPYFTNNDSNSNTDLIYSSNTEYASVDNSLSVLWEMRNQLEANYFEIRYKPLLIMLSSNNLKISFTFGKNFQNKTTFERYQNMNGEPSPSGKNYSSAVRNEEKIELTWDGVNNDYQKIILFDVASGFSLNNATIETTSDVYALTRTNQTTYNIKSYVFSLKITEPINNVDYKFFNTAIKNFTELNTSTMVVNNRRFNITFTPNEPESGFNIFTYDDSVSGFPIISNPIDERNDSTDRPFNLLLELEKIDLNDYNQLSDSFENATNLNSSFNNVNIINRLLFYLFNNNFSTSSGVLASSPIITLDLTNNSIDNIALTKGLINNILEKNNPAIKTVPEFIQAENNELDFFMLLIKQNFLTDYWKFKENLSELSLDIAGNKLNAKMLDFDYQRRVAASIHLIDIALSGQIFLINTAKNKSDIRYINTIDSEILDETSNIGNPTLNFNNVENIFPSIDADNPIYLNIRNNASGSDSIFINKNYNSYPGTFSQSNLQSGTTEISQPLYVTQNVFDINTLFSNTSDEPDKTISTSDTPTQYNGIYYYDITVGPSSNEKLVNYDIFPGKILVNLVEMPEITNEDVTINLTSDNKKVIVQWPRYYYDSSQGEITWTIVRQDMASLAEITRTYTINSSEISNVNENIVYIDTEIRRFDKYQYTISGVFNFNSFVTINSVVSNYNLSLNINAFTTDIVFICFGYTRRFPFGRFNTTTTNLKLYVPKLLRSNLNSTTKEFFKSQLLLTNPVPPGVTEEYHLENNITTWPGGRGACVNAQGQSETFGRTLTQVSENIYANTTNQLSKKQIYNLLAKSRFRPDR